MVAILPIQTAWIVEWFQSRRNASEYVDVIDGESQVVIDGTFELSELSEFLDDKMKGKP